MRCRPDRAIQATASPQETAVGERHGPVTVVGRLVPLLLADRMADNRCAIVAGCAFE